MTIIPICIEVAGLDSEDHEVRAALERVTILFADELKILSWAYETAAIAVLERKRNKHE